ncbi:putative ribonuclease H-like domain-containing protein [Tanacetum coccineum]
MDVKSAFLYGTIEEEVYVHQPLGFVDPAHPNKVYKVVKALYGLHQAPRAWYETLSSFLLENGFRRGTIDKTLFIKKNKSDIMLVQVYVDGIIFGSTKKSMCTKFEEVMYKRFHVSSMGELTFFLGLQVKQQRDGILISQDKYVANILKKFDFYSIKTATTPIESNKPLVKDEDGVKVDVHEYQSMIGSLIYLTGSRPDIMFAVYACARDSLFELEAFSDSDYAGANLDMKSKTGGCQFLGRRLISWQCKKQTVVANSTAKAEYVAAAHYCGQVLWIQNHMMDYGFNFMNTKIHVDNESTICVVKNPIYHSRTKHIEIRHHFIRDCYEKRLIDVLKIHTDSNVADLLTKGFDVTRFNFLVVVDFLKVRTIANGTQQLVTSIDSKEYTITEASVRSKLQLADATGIHNLSDAEIYAGLATLGYITEGLDFLPWSRKMALQIGGFNLPGAGVGGPTEVPTKVLFLTEMVSVDALMDDGEYEDILEDMREGGKFGDLTNVVIPRPNPNEDQVHGLGKEERHVGEPEHAVPSVVPPCKSRPFNLYTFGATMNPGFSRSFGSMRLIKVEDELVEVDIQYIRPSKTRNTLKGNEKNLHMDDMHMFEDKICILLNSKEYAFEVT